MTKNTIVSFTSTRGGSYSVEYNSQSHVITVYANGMNGGPLRFICVDGREHMFDANPKKYRIGVQVGMIGDQRVLEVREHHTHHVFTLTL